MPNASQGPSYCEEKKPQGTQRNQYLSFVMNPTILFLRRS